MDTTFLIHGDGYAPSTTPPQDPRFLQLQEALAGLGFKSVFIEGREMGCHAVAVKLENGHPLYINFQHRTWAERSKGFLHFFTFTSVYGDKTHEAKEALQLVEPARFTLSSITAKKLAATLQYWCAVSSLALDIQKAANSAVNEWREKMAASPYEFRPFSFKENSQRAVNGSIHAGAFEFSIGIEERHPHPSQSITYRGGNDFKAFMCLADDTSTEKQWFTVDFTGGLADCVALHICYGTKYAVELWAAKNEKIYGGIGYIITPSKLFPRGTNRHVHIVTLGAL